MPEGLASPFSRLRNLSFLPRETLLLTDLQVNPLRTVPETSSVLPHRYLCYLLPLPDNRGLHPKASSFEGQWRLFPPKLPSLIQMIIISYQTHFASASHHFELFYIFDLWLTDLRMQLPRIPRHMKGSKYHTLIDSESYFLPHTVWEFLCCLWLVGAGQERLKPSGCTWGTISASGIRSQE